MADDPNKASPANDRNLPIIKNIFDFSAESLGQVKTWLEQNPPAIPITQIIGFQQFTAQIATSVATSETTNSTSFTDLTTTGPTLSNLPNGKYLVVYGADVKVDTALGNVGSMAIQVNATSAAAADAAITATTFLTSVMKAVGKTLSNGNNTVTAKYKSADAGTNATFQNRWLIALRYSN